MGQVPMNSPLPPSSYERIRDDYFNRADVITNAMVKDCGLLGKESHSEVNMDHVRMIDDLPTFNEPPLKRARTTIIHEGGDAYHSSTQELPHQNVYHFEAASSRQLQLIQLDVASLKKQFGEHQLYVKSELISIKETLKCILTFTLMDKKALDKGESSQKYVIPPSMQDDDVIYHGLIVKDTDIENNEDVNKDDTHTDAKDGDVHMEEGSSNNDQGDGDIDIDEGSSKNNQNEEAT
ncbi:hypothetical protein FNV43_RR10476 [Rhamnella rubrinervis]|uniref:Uncharacterized protein n=1 Tax=Rhamnella rubrinervis TaxID=2594499 RepID=A0A8K0HD98_9ROSA|nr:hypothetical protein FNV43_RR10476 [Rhamnella rubrinervis]